MEAISLSRRDTSRYPKRYPRSLESWSRSSRSRLGGLTKQREHLKRKLYTTRISDAPDKEQKESVIREKLATVHKRIDRAREAYDVVSLPKERDNIKIWEVTRYYTYLRTTKSRKRSFEVRIPVPFLIDWTGDQVEVYAPDIERLCDEALAKAWMSPAGTLAPDWAEKFEKILEDGLYDNFRKGWAVGWEAGAEKKVDVKRTQSLRAEVVDKTGRIFGKPRHVHVNWDIPGTGEEP